jgi:uncharacterized protein (DUF885 family)
MQHPELARLSDDFFDVKVELDPLSASLMGINRAADRLPDLSAETHAAFASRLRSLEREVLGIDEPLLGEDDRVTRQVLLHELSTSATSLEDGTVEMSAGGSLSPFALLLSVLPKTESSSSATDYVARLRAVPGMLDQAGDRFTQGAAAGRTTTRRGLEQTISQIDIVLDTRGAPFCIPFAADEDVVAVVQDVVAPALVTFREHLTGLLPAARSAEHSGLVHVPGGQESYAHRVQEHTTTDRTPEAIHKLGLDMCAALREEYAVLGGKVFGTEAFEDVVDRLRNDPELRYRTPEEIESDAKAALARAEQAVPEWFGTLHRAPCEVHRMGEVEAPTGVLGYYQPSSSGLGRPGRHWINTHAPQTRTRYEYETLAFHESVPGHHLQFSLADELSSLPAFRRNGYVTAFGEGWALYTERLCDEMGLYSSDLARFGMLSFDSWRASRLVVDTGIHAFGWTRQQGIEFMMANTALTAENIANEVDRYISWPGQALAYMTGRLEIDRLRRLALEHRGPRFDIKAFHDIVLGGGSLPLNVLADVVSRWALAA